VKSRRPRREGIAARRVLRLAATLTAIFVAACVARRGDAEDWTAPPDAVAMANPQVADAASLARGGQVYSSECLACHGVHGRGDGPDGFVLDPPPSDLTSQRVVGESDGTLFFRISEGHEGMPPFAPRLSAEQRWHLVNYVRTLASDPRSGGRK
jgi:mono/diheme cytochrome c family protein